MYAGDLRRFLPLAAAVLLAGLVIGTSGCSSVEGPSPALVAEARGDQCVEPLHVIRKDHMKILLQERDEAKRFGRRNPEHSFVGCIDCHVSPTASKAEPATHFCLACHQFNAVRMDCFQCHRDTPYGGDQAAYLGHQALHAALGSYGQEIATP